MQLLFFGVPRQLEHFHAVAQRVRHRVEHVGGGQEQHLGQIERHVEVVIGEGVVLFGIEHLEQRRGRVAAEVHAELVDLVEDEQRIVRAGVAQALDDAAGQRADVGAAMAANLGLVADAAKRQPHELASEGARDRSAERGLAGARRPDEAQDRTLGVVLELAHGEKLEDALLDFFEVVVILVEHCARVLDVEVVFGRHAPRQADEPVEVGAHDGMLGRLGRDHLEALEFLVGDLARLGRHLRLFDLFFDFLDFGAARVAVAQLFLNRLKLLAQVVLALILVELGLHLRLDLVPQFEHLDLAPEDRDQLFQPRTNFEGREQILRLFDRDLKVRGDHVGQAAGLLHLHRHHLQFVGQVRHQRNKLGELADEMRVQRVDFLVGRIRLDQPGHVREEVRLALAEFAELDTRQSLHQNAHALIGVTQHLEDTNGGAARE